MYFEKVVLCEQAPLLFGRNTSFQYFLYTQIKEAVFPSMGGNFFSNEGLKDSFLANKKMHSTTFLCPSPSDGNKEVEFMYSSQSGE